MVYETNLMMMRSDVANMHVVLDLPGLPGGLRYQDAIPAATTGNSTDRKK